jgi:hypothetical protein
MCKHTPCVIAKPPEPAFACVIEMVPVTVMKTKTNVEFVPICTKTVMETKIDTVYEEQTQTVCKLVFDTVFEDRCVTVCRPVCETTMVCQPYRVCRPVTTTRHVTEYCVQASTELVPMSAKGKCGHRGHSEGGCNCNTVAWTCYKRVPVVREVTETHLVTEVRTQIVPVVRWRTITEQTIEKVPVTTRRVVDEVVRVRVPRLVFRTVPKTLVYKTAVLSCEEIPVVVYRPVMKMVPAVEPSPQTVPSSEDAASPFNPAGDIAPESRSSSGRQNPIERSTLPEIPESPIAPPPAG